MIFLYILLGLATLVALILYLPLRILLSYDEDSGLTYKLRYAFFCLADSTEEKPPKEEKPKQPKTKQKKKDRSATGTLLRFLGLEDLAGLGKALKEKGLCQTLSDIASGVKNLLVRIGRLIGKARFRRFDLQILVGDADAGDAALNYGRACALLYPVLDSLKPVKRCKKRRIDLRCDFLRDESLIRFDGELIYRPWHLVAFVGGLIWNYIKRSVKAS